MLSVLSAVSPLLEFSRRKLGLADRPQGEPPSMRMVIQLHFKKSVEVRDYFGEGQILISFLSADVTIDGRDVQLFWLSLKFEFHFCRFLVDGKKIFNDQKIT